MCNCGKKRTELTQQNNVAAPQISTAITLMHQNNNNLVFEYNGKTALTVIGNITGRQYRFNRPGERQPIDPRDARGMMAVSVLTRIQ